MYKRGLGVKFLYRGVKILYYLDQTTKIFVYLSLNAIKYKNNSKNIWRFQK